MARVEVPTSLLRDVSVALEDEDLTRRLGRYLPRNGNGHGKSTCEAKRTALSGSLHKGVHVCGLKENHKGDHQCNRIEAGTKCEATWHKLVRTPVAVTAAV